MILDELKIDLKFYIFYKDNRCFRKNESSNDTGVCSYEYTAELIRIARYLQECELLYSVDKDQNIYLL